MHRLCFCHHTTTFTSRVCHAGALFLALLLACATARLATAMPARPLARASASSPCANPASFTPKQRPELRIQRADAEINIDGVLDDPGWATTPPIKGFTEIQPGDQARPPVCTTVRVTYDASHLYVAFHAYDDPSTIRASMRNRDEIFQDDWVGLILDPFGDAAQAYEIFANPLGIQGDLLMRNGGSEDIGFDLVYRSEGRITGDGYIVEMAIPFSSIRFPDRAQQQWRATFLRTRPRASRQQFSWATVSRDDPCFMCQFGTLTGLDGVRPSTNVDVIPTLVGTQSASESAGTGPALDNDRLRVEPSMTVRYGVTPSLGVEATVNPDFSQVESDAAQIDVNSTFALSFPERRPFFQEGSDLFATPIDVVYTRSINAPSVAAKTTGRFGRTSAALLAAVDEESPMLLPFAESSTIVEAGRSVSHIARVRQTFGGNSFAGAMLTDRRLLDAHGSGSVASADAGVQFWTTYRVEGQIAVSRIQEPVRPEWTEDDDVVTDVDSFGANRTATLDGDAFWGSAGVLSVSRQARHWSAELAGRQYSPGFRAPNGFIQRNAYRRVSLWQGYTFYHESGWLERAEPATFGFLDWDTGGQVRERYGQVQIWTRWKGQTFVFANVGTGRERFRGRMFERLHNWNVEVNSNFSEPVRLGFFVTGGRSIYRGDVPERGRKLNASVWATFRPLQRLVIEPQVRYASLHDLDTDATFFAGTIARAKTSLQVTRALSARLITQYNHFGGDVVLEPLVSYRINPFTVFYVGSNHDYAVPEDDAPRSTRTLIPTSRQFFFKFQYLLRV